MIEGPILRVKRKMGPFLCYPERKPPSALQKSVMAVVLFGARIFRNIFFLNDAFDAQTEHRLLTALAALLAFLFVCLFLKDLTTCAPMIIINLGAQVGGDVYFCTQKAGTSSRKSTGYGNKTQAR